MQGVHLRFLFMCLSSLVSLFWWMGRRQCEVNGLVSRVIGDWVEENEWLGGRKWVCDCLVYTDFLWFFYFYLFSFFHVLSVITFVVVVVVVTEGIWMFLWLAMLFPFPSFLLFPYFILHTVHLFLSFPFFRHVIVFPVHKITQLIFLILFSLLSSLKFSSFHDSNFQWTGFSLPYFLPLFYSSCWTIRQLPRCSQVNFSFLFFFLSTIQVFTIHKGTNQELFHFCLFFTHKNV